VVGTGWRRSPVQSSPVHDLPLRAAAQGVRCVQVSSDFGVFFDFDALEVRIQTTRGRAAAWHVACRHPSRRHSSV
jgi:hypothetical protein